MKLEAVGPFKYGRNAYSTAQLRRQCTNDIVWHVMSHTCIELGIQLHQGSTLEDRPPLCPFRLSPQLTCS